MSKNIKLGNFNLLASAYKKSRPGYSNKILHLIQSLQFYNSSKISCLDLGSGTGIFTKQLAKISDKVVGVELSKEMIKNAYKIKNVRYINESANKVNFDQKFDVFTAASCFHWFNDFKISKLVKKNLKQYGYFLICYNSRDISGDVFLNKVENKIFSLSKKFNSRISSGQSNFVKKKINKFTKLSKLKGPLYFEFSHVENFSKKRYFTVWESSNEFRSKLGEENYNVFLSWLDQNFPNKGIKAKYKNKCWLLQKQY